MADLSPPIVLEDAVIAIMGPTGTGKSSFIRLVTGADNVVVGNSLDSQTSQVSYYAFRLLDGRRTILVDTPGFDDSRQELTDADILQMISGYLMTEYKRGRKLNGVIYMHNISNTRMSGVDLRNLKMFKQLVGEECFCNVVIVTTMWSTVDMTIGEKREEELKTKDTFFKPLLDKGAQILRHDSELSSAQRIVDTIVQKPPKELLIQTELSEPGKRLVDSSAGADLAAEFARLDERDRKKLRDLEDELKECRNQALKRDIEEERARLSHRITSREGDRRKLDRDVRELGFVSGLCTGYRVLGFPGMVYGGIAGSVGAKVLDAGKAFEQRFGTSQEKSVAHLVPDFVDITARNANQFSSIGKQLGGNPGAIFGGAVGTAVGFGASVFKGFDHIMRHSQDV